MILFHFQKVKTFRALSMTIAMALSSPLLAGGVAGGGGPPAHQDLQLMLQSSSFSARIFAWDETQLGLGVDAPLPNEMLLTRAEDSSAALQISAEDFNEIAAGTQSIQAVNLDGEVRAYEVKTSASPDTLRLVAP